MYIPIKKVTGTGNVLSDGSAVPAFMCAGANQTYTLLSAGGVTFDYTFSTSTGSIIIEIPIKQIITSSGTPNMTLLGQ